MDELEILISSTVEVDKQKSLTQINNDIKKIEEQLRKLKLTATLDNVKSKAEIQRRIEAFNKQRKKLYVDLQLRKDALKKQYQELQKESNFKLNVDTTIAQKGINQTTNAVQATRSETVTLASSLQKAFANMGLVVSAQTALQAVRKAAAEAAEAVKLYDSYLTNLSIITGGSRENSNKILGDLAEKSLDFKVDVSSLEGATETLLRTGKSIDEINKYLENTIYLSKLGFQDMDTSASQLVTIGNAFEYTADEMSAVVDKFTKLDTSASVTAGKLAEGVAKSAQNAKLAGFNIDQLSASIAGLKDLTGRSESEVSNSLNMIFSRLQNVKLGKYVIETEDGSEDITEALNDTEEILNTVNIKLRDSKNEFRDINELFTELSNNWSKFNSVQKSAIATTIAGARQRNTFVAMIENWNKIQELTDISLNSTGTAAEKYNNYLQSIEAKSATLSTSMKELWNDLLPTNFVGNMVDAGTAVVQFTDKYQILQTALKSAAFYGLAKGIILAKDGFAGMVTSVKNVSAAMNLATQSGAMTSQRMADLRNMTKVLTDSQLKLVLSNSNLSKAQMITILRTEGVSEAEAEQRLATLGITQANQQATNATFSLSGAFKSLWATIAANPLAALTVAFTAINSVISAYKRKQEELIESAKQSAQETSEYIDDLNGLKEKYLEIVDSESSVSEKTQELNKFKQELVETYGFEKDILDQLNASREHGIELLDRETQKQAQARRNEFYAQNDDTIQKSIKEIENTHEIVYNGMERDYNSLPDNIKSMFTKPENSFRLFSSSHQLKLKIDAKDIYDEYEKVNALIVDLQKKNDLNLGEQNLLSALEMSSKNLKKKIDDYGNIYQTYYEYKAQDLIEEYVSKYGDAANLIGNELESWKNGLYKAADGNIALGKSLESLIDKVYQFNDAENDVEAELSFSYCSRAILFSKINRNL